MAIIHKLLATRGIFNKASLFKANQYFLPEIVSLTSSISNAKLIFCILFYRILKSFIHLSQL